MWYVYIIRSQANHSYYKGITDDLQRRLLEHNSGKEKYTSKYTPWELVWYCIKPTQQEARQLEMKLKNLTSKKRLEQFIRKYSSGGPDAPAGGLDADIRP